MESLILKDRRKSQRIPVALTVLGQIDGRSIAMSSDNISLDGMFLFSREFVPPQTIFAARVWLSNEEEPLQTWLTSCFTERTWTGYGIGVHLSGISNADAALWESFYRCCAADRAPPLPTFGLGEPLADNQHIVVVDNALSPLAMQALRKHGGLAVSHVPSVDEALRLVQRGSVDAVISDLHRPGLDGLALCCHVNGNRLPTRTVLLTNGTGPREFLLGLYAGATCVIAKMCSNDILVSRILAVLQQPLPAGREVISASANTLPAPVPPPPIGSPRPAATRTSPGIGQVYRYLSDRLLRRQSA